MGEPVVERLRNWGFVMRLAWLPAHCASAEWRHVQFRGLTEGEEETRRTAKHIVDYRDAELVERAWCFLPSKEQKLLLYTYIWRSRTDQICRRLGISRETIDGHFVYFDLAQSKAHRSIQRVLDDALHNNVVSRALDVEFSRET